MFPVFLFVALFLLALAPNLSVLIVTTRASTAGFRQGMSAALGIVVATSVYIVAAIFVLMIVADMRPEARHVLRVIAAVYLIMNGTGLIRNAARAPRAALPVTQRDAASFATGFILTLVNVKAIVFYICFLPLFVGIGSLNLHETAIVLETAALAGGLAKLGYAAVASGGRMVPSVSVGKFLNVIAGIVVAVAGFLLATRGAHI